MLLGQTAIGRRRPAHPASWSGSKPLRKGSVADPMRPDWVLTEDDVEILP